MTPTRDLIADLERMVSTMQNMITAMRGDPEPAQRWRAKYGEAYWYWDKHPHRYVDWYDTWNNEHWRVGNYYRSKEYAATHEVEPAPQNEPAQRQRWRAETGDEYRFVADSGNIRINVEGRRNLDDLRWRHGNYFETEDEARSSKFYKVFHEEQVGDRKNRTTEKPE